MIKVTKENKGTVFVNDGNNTDREVTATIRTMDNEQVIIDVEEDDFSVSITLPQSTLSLLRSK